MSGKVYRILSNFYYVKYENVILECKARGVFKNNNTEIAVGDNVVLEHIDMEKMTAHIVEVKDRKNIIVRPFVANIDILVLIISMNAPKYDAVLLDRQLIYCKINDIKPIICINKIDLYDEKEYLNFVELYTKIGYEVFCVSVKDDIGIETLKENITGKVCALSGMSGVGKSSLTNAICDITSIKEGDMSEKILRGKHTTRHVELYECNDIVIVDTPGFSTFDLLKIFKEELYEYYPEFSEYIEDCEYRDCTHIKEDKCGIKNAILEGNISQERYDRFLKIYSELKSKGDEKK